jgi:hypothetical protein
MDRCATRRLGCSGYSIGSNARVLWVLYRLLVLCDTTGRQQVYVDDRSSCASASQSESQQARTYAVRRLASAVQYFWYSAPMRTLVVPSRYRRVALALTTPGTVGMVLLQ